MRNTSAGVDIEVDGEANQLRQFVVALKRTPPPLSVIDSLEVFERTADGFTQFVILPSAPDPLAFQPISPDIAVCPDCLCEMLDPTDRRYRYPFINCTNCGPRFTIIKDIPYDRPNTTMDVFDMCPDCREEYEDPANRRFHAQPIACPVCGPSVWLETDEKGIPPLPDEISKAQYLLATGKIVAIKGIGGFHLACDAHNLEAVKRLRERKLRVEKPFAVMAPDIASVKVHCKVNALAQALLESPQRPIVILDRKKTVTLPQSLAPGQNTLGFMLPYTPLHHLLFLPPSEEFPFMPPQVLVMTSGNKSEEPIAVTNEEAREKLADIADAFLMHNREIHIRCDDSVIRLNPASGKSYPIRRSRGFAPFPVRLPWKMPSVLAAGAELKNTFCMTKDDYAFLSHHIGDMENYETLVSFEEGIRHFKRLFRIEPQVIACDKHPDYLATRVARKMAEDNQLPLVEVQHHHAHIAACMAENHLPAEEQVIGVAFDGTGYGDDGAIWGGEFMIASYQDYQRVYHLQYMPLPGGDAAIKNPARIALAYLWQAGLEWQPHFAAAQAVCAQDQLTLRAQLERAIYTPATSSMGRLFDAVSALLGIRTKITYEAQAAIELEAICDSVEQSSYPLEGALPGQNLPLHTGQIALTPMLAAIAADISASVPAAIISAKFHNTIAELVQQACLNIRQISSIKTVALSGGVWQNMTLLWRTARRLRAAGFHLLMHSKTPPNDGSISLGQAVAAYHILNQR